MLGTGMGHMGLLAGIKKKEKNPISAADQECYPHNFAEIWVIQYRNQGVS